MSATIYDVIVVGGGVIGLSTARYLSKRGSKILLIDQFSLPHTYGSSHGKSRGIRYTYKTFHHVEMMPEAFDEWKKLENETHSKLLIKCGIVCLCDDEERNAIAQNINKINADCTILSSDEVEKRYPGFKTDGIDGIYDPAAGILKADDCLWALKTSYMLAAGQIVQGTVVKVEPINEQTVRVYTNNQVYVTKSVVLTCGPWINDLLKPLRLQLPIAVNQSLITYWKTQTANSYSYDKFPITCVTKPSVLLYAVPESEYPGYVKIGIHEGFSVSHASNPDSMPNKATVQAEQIEKMKILVKKHFPKIVPEPNFIQKCMYSMTPDEDFILDIHPNYSNIVIGAGFSGHGFKLAPVIGSILGNLALKKDQKYSLQPFLLKRFFSPKHLL